MAPASLLVLLLKDPKESQNDDAVDGETIDASTMIVPGVANDFSEEGGHEGVT